MGDFSSLDMGPTVTWYGRNAEAIYTRLPQPLPSHTDLSLGLRYPVNKVGFDSPCPCGPGKFLALMNLVPLPLRQCSNLVAIEVQPPTWFMESSMFGLLMPTKNPSKALSSMAIVPSYVKYDLREDMNPFTFSSTIIMYQLRSDQVQRHVQVLVWAQAFLHEFCHTFVTPLLRDSEDRLPKLRFPNGEVVSGFEYLIRYLDLVQSHAPISHYASTFSNPDNTLASLDPLTALSEHLVEGLVAYLLGFAFRLDGTGLEPFREREPLRQHLLGLLGATLA